MKPKTIVLLIVIVLFLILILRNSQAVTFWLFFWPIEMSQIILTLVTLLIGFVVGFVVAKLTGRKPARTVAQPPPSETVQS